jgi:putative beta-lysine N-acetyltransferase
MLFAVGVLTPAGLDVRVDPYNRRVRFVGPDRPAAVDQWLATAGDALDEIGKIIVYARDDDDRGWERRGFVQEGRIDRFFVDGRDAKIWSRFIDDVRRENPRGDAEDRIIQLAREKAGGMPETLLPSGVSCRIAREQDARVISILLGSTFRDYPDAVDEENVARWIRQGERLFRVALRDGVVVACASAELDRTNRSAELTDCATDPEMRGKGLMTAILRMLENDCSEQFGITDTYTLARAGEAGINIAFARLGYDFTGRLVNNCRMPDGWESMNAWCRSV